jgi:uncharacterized C2H2 Zn-finger protein
MPKFDMFAPCPACGAVWAYEQDDRAYTRCIGVEVLGGYDGVSYWRCPDCGAEWDRWTGERR